MLKPNSQCPPLPPSRRARWDAFYLNTAPVFLRPGPNMQECETRMFACTLAAPSGVWDKAWPRPGGWDGREWGWRAQAWAFGEAGLRVVSELARRRGRHVGQGRAASREKAGGHGRPDSFSPEPGYGAGELEANSHHWMLSAACWGKHALVVRSSQHEFTLAVEHFSCKSAGLQDSIWLIL